MHIITATVVMLALTALPSRAGETVRVCSSMEGYRQFDFPRFERNYVESLRFGVDGVVESALMNVVLIKLAQPQVQSKSISRILDDLAIEGNSPAIRYKAALAKQVFDSPDIFEPDRWREYLDEQDVFAAISRRLDRVLLTSENR